jgi:hypothetical protein
MTLKEAVLKWHPDHNGGDHTMLPLLIAFQEQRQLQQLKEKRCLCGCGRKLYSPHVNQSKLKMRKFFSYACHNAYRVNFRPKKGLEQPKQTKPQNENHL